MKKYAVLAAAVIAQAAFAMSGNELHSFMQTDSDPYSRLTAASYVVGLTDGISFGNYLLKEGGTQLGAAAICLPEGSQVQQAYDVIKEYLASHPESRHKDAGALAAFALHRVWPCK